MDGVSVFTYLLTVLMLAAMAIDATRYLIPNALNLALLALYPVAAFLLPIDWPMALLAGALVLLAGLGIFALGLMGGGDVKLIAIGTVWCGWTAVAAQFLMLTTLFGGVLVVAVLLARWLVPPLFYRARATPRLLTRKQPVPYGIAIAAAFLALLWAGQIPGLPH